MSIVATNWMRDLDIPSGPKAELMWLADHHNAKTGRCDPSVGCTARESGRKRRSVQYSRRYLERAGLITRHERPGRRTSYTLHIGRQPLPMPAPAVRTPAEVVVAEVAPVLPDMAMLGIPVLATWLVPIAPTCAFFAPHTCATVAPKPEEEDSTGRKEMRAREGAPPTWPSPLDDSDLEGQEAPADPTAAALDPPAPPRNAVQLRPQQPPPRGRSRGRGGSPLPDDWQPSPIDRAAALACGYDPDALMPRFRRWHLSRGKRFDDWSQRFQEWVLLQPAIDRLEQQYGPRPMSAAERREATAAAVKARVARMQWPDEPEHGAPL